MTPDLSLDPETIAATERIHAWFRENLRLKLEPLVIGKKRVIETVKEAEMQVGLMPVRPTLFPKAKKPHEVLVKQAGKP